MENFSGKLRYYPIQIDTVGKKLLVIGGGKIATRKIRSFLRTEIKIDVKAKVFSGELIKLSMDNKINLMEELVNEDTNIEGYHYIITATDDKELNEVIRNRAKVHNIMVLDASSGENSDFHMTKIINEKGMLISITTLGDNPTVSEIVGDEVKELLDKLDGDKIELLSKIRNKLVQQGCKEIKDIIKNLYYKSIDEVEKYYESLDIVIENKIRN